MKPYRQHCGVAKALDVVGERWTLLIIRDLLLGGRRYTDLLENLPGLTTNLLARRLRDLEARGVVARRRLAPPGAAMVYELTPLGAQLEPAVLALGAFGANWLHTPDPNDRKSLRWLLVSVRRRYRGGATPGVIQLVADEVPFVVEIGAASIVTRDGRSDRVDTTVVGSAASIVALLGARVPLDDLPDVEVEGPAALVQRLQERLDPA